MIKTQTLFLVSEWRKVFYHIRTRNCQSPVWTFLASSFLVLLPEYWSFVLLYYLWTWACRWELQFICPQMRSVWAPHVQLQMRVEKQRQWRSSARCDNHRSNVGQEKVESVQRKVETEKQHSEEPHTDTKLSVY